MRSSQWKVLIKKFSFQKNISFSINHIRILKSNLNEQVVLKDALKSNNKKKVDQIVNKLILLNLIKL